MVFRYKRINIFYVENVRLDRLCCAKISFKKLKVTSISEKI